MKKMKIKENNVKDKKNRKKINAETKMKIRKKRKKYKK